MARNNSSYSEAHRKYVEMYRKTMNYMVHHPKFANDIKNGIIKQQGQSKQTSHTVTKQNPFSKPSNSQKSTQHKTFDKANAKPLYLKNAFVFLRKKDKKPFLSVVIAKRRDGKNPGISAKAPYGMGYVSNYQGKSRNGTYTYHNQAMSMYSINKVLSASGHHPMNTAQFTKAAGAKTKNGYKAPLFTSRNNIAFKANIRPDIGKYGKHGVNGHHNYVIDTRTISKGTPFNYFKEELPLEHRAYQTMKAHYADRNKEAQNSQQSKQNSTTVKHKNPFAKQNDDGLGL